MAPRGLQRRRGFARGGSLNLRNNALEKHAADVGGRHVRVHHVDKDKDDPLLREVLAQRIEGLGKQRRRRTNANGNVT